MENKMQDSKREELRERMAKHELLDSQLYRKDPIDGSWDSFMTVTENVLDFITSEISKAREEGRREVYEAIVFDKNIPHDVTTFVAANLWKNMRDKAKEELSKLNNKK